MSATDTKLLYDDNAAGDAANICHFVPGIYTITDGVNGNEDVTIDRVIVTGRFSGIAILSSALTLGHGDDCIIQLKTAVNISDGGGG